MRGYAYPDGSCDTSTDSRSVCQRRQGRRMPKNRLEFFTMLIGRRAQS